MRCKHIAILPAAVAAALLCGCYHATQTPVIGPNGTDKQVEQRLTPEQSLLRGIAPEPPARWQPGKRWRVTDDKIRMVLRGVPDGVSLANRDILLVSIEPTPSLMGNDATTITLRVDDPEQAPILLTYTIDAPPQALAERQRLDIPFTVDCAMVDEAAALLTGRDVYTLTSTWLDANGQYMTGGRYMPAKITKVLPGEPQAPLRVIFTPGYDPALSATVLMTASAEGTGPRDFAAMFALSDPRNRFPNIYPDIWALITQGKVQQGMTRQECRLALGAPTETSKQEYYGFTREIWTYGNGRYLVFEDDTLINFAL